MRKQGTVKKYLGMGYIIASFFFLFNPDIAIIDFLPDVIGYLLLIIGTTQLSEINEKISEAREGFKKAAICNLIKVSLIVVLFGFVTPQEFPVSMLLFTFVMNIFDMIYAVPSYLNLFGGLIYLGERLDGEYLLSRKRFIPRRAPDFKSEKARVTFERKELKRRYKCERSLSKTESARNATFCFAIFKAAGSLLPEFTSLLNYEYSNSLVNYYDFIPIYRAFAFIAVFGVSISWLVKMVKYIAGMKKDSIFIEALRAKYTTEVTPNKVYFEKKNSNLARLIFSVAAFLSINIYFDRYNILPGFVAAILFVLGSLYVKKYTNKWGICFATSSLWGFVSIIAEIFRWRFNAEFIPEQIARNPEAYKAWEGMFIIFSLEALVHVIFIICLILTIVDITRRYTGFFSPGTDAYDPKRATKELHTELCRPLILTALLGCAAAVLSAVYIYSIFARFEAIWIAELLVDIFFAVSLSLNLSAVVSNINFGHFLKNE